ncbi:WxL domain-containing protein [Enterococcus sp. CR-Ec1]|uniref:WxL domain-containing protein n=1 Tax=Enterococcus sp. CR-Ec1 TaxID=2057791 RepID=UPI001F1AD6D1|nr:WxL domain-containing protein [Enterococcus sp. CR-Ec1]
MKKQNLKYWIRLLLVFMGLRLMSVPLIVVFAETEPPYLAQPLADEGVLGEFATGTSESEGTVQFKEPKFAGTVGQPLTIDLVSDQAVAEIFLELPAEVKLMTDVLAPGQTAVKQSDQGWQIKASQARQTFSVLIVAELPGSFVIASAGSEAIVEIAAAETDTEETPKDLENESLESQETDSDPAEKVADIERPQEESAVQAASEIVPSAFDGGTAYVTTMAEFISALQDPAVSILSLQADLVQSTSSIMTIDRPIMIQGNGHALTLNNNSAYFQLLTVNEETIFRIENLTYQKTGNTALIQTTNALSKNWVVELEEVEEASENRSPFILAREAKVHFTGGINHFEAMTMASDTLFNLKEVEVGNQAQVIINKPNMWIFYTAPDIQDPRLLIDEGAQVSITTRLGDANTIDLRGDNGQMELNHGARLTIRSPGTTAAPTNGNNNAVILSGRNPRFIAAENSVFSIEVTERKRGLVLTGEQPELTIQSGANVTINTMNASAILLNGFFPSATIAGDETQVRVNNETAADANAIELVGDNSNFYLFDGGTLIVESQGAATAMSEEQNIALFMKGTDPTMVVGDAALLQIETTQRRRGVFLTGENPKLTIQNGSKVRLTAENANALRVNGKNADVTISGEETHVRIFSEIAAAEGAASFVLSTPSNAAEAGALTLSESAVLEVESITASAINITSLNFTFKVQSNGQLIASSHEADGDHAVIRFLYFGLVTFHVTDGGIVKVRKIGGSAPLIRIPSGGNSFEITEGGIVDLYNPGNGNAHDGNVAGGNQGIFYARGIHNNGTENNFSIVGVDSKFMCVADSGPGIDMHTYFNSTIYVEQGYFQVEGRTSSPNGGVFRSGKLSVFLNDPVFFDFRNERLDGGNIFSVSNLSTLTATNSDLAVWKNGSNLLGDPDLNFPPLDFAFSGADFGTLGLTNKPEILNTEAFGNQGLTAYSRVSSNNARWAIVDELRVPTNADKKIHGRVSLPVGFDGTRPAWDDEAKVTVEIETADGEKEEVTAKTVGHTEETPGISIYGEEPQGGIFEIPLESPLEAGTIVRVVAVELTSGELTEGAQHQIRTESVQVFPVLPPTPAAFASYVLLEETTEIHGHTEDKEVELSAAHNGAWFDTEAVVIDEDGTFTIDVSDRQLKAGDEIQVFLKDSAGSAKEAGVINPPTTNDEHGNQNPASEVVFRDAVFPAATTLRIAQTGPLPPVDPLEPDVEVNPENPSVIPENQGLLSLDFVSQFRFGQVPIRSAKGTYHALPQHMNLAEGATETKERPNYVQITDQRNDAEETSWRLSATLDSQGFQNEDNEPLIGAQISLANQRLMTTSANSNASMPELSTVNDSVTLTPGEAQPLLTGDSQSTGTWVYRFGDQETAATSVALEVPAGANPKLGWYRATIEWSLSSVPE